MAETVMFIRGEFPFGFEPGVPSALISDLKVVSSLSEDQLKAIAHEISTFSGFMDSDALKGVIASRVDNAEQSQSLFRVVSFLDTYTRKQTIESFLSGVNEKFSKTEFQEVQRRLPIIARKYPALQRFAKAQRLTHATGMAMEDFQIICDVRPVFDEEHATVDGVIPYTILKVVCKGVDGLPVQMEAILSYNQVVKLAERATDAEKKLKVLGELLRGKGFAIPAVDMIKSKGGSDGDRVTS